MAAREFLSPAGASSLFRIDGFDASFGGFESDFRFTRPAFDPGPAGVGRGNPVGAAIVNRCLGLGLTSAIFYGGEGQAQISVPSPASGDWQAASWSWEDFRQRFEGAAFQPDVAIGGQRAAVEQAESDIRDVVAARIFTNAVNASVQPALAAARGAARVDTGAMRSSLTVQAGSNGVFVSAGVDYAIYYANEFVPPAGRAANDAFQQVALGSSLEC